MARTSGVSAGMLFVMGMIFIVVGAGVAWFIGKPILDKSRASSTWPKASGTIVSSEVAEGRNKGKRHYWAAVEYSFPVNGQELTGRTVSFGASRSSSRTAPEAIVARYPAGKPVDVYYNPEQPDISVLEPGVTAASYFVLIIGLVLLGAGVFCFLGALVVARRRP